LKILYNQKIILALMLFFPLRAAMMCPFTSFAPDDQSSMMVLYL